MTWGANEIAFIEDELSAMAEAYDLEIDEDVAQHVEQRQGAKRKRRKVKTSSTKKGDQTTLPLETILQNLLPENHLITFCSVPGCKCNVQQAHKTPHFHCDA